MTPRSISAAGLEKALISLGVDGFKSRKAFDLWGLLAAHPARADLASHEAELKGLLKELAAPGLKLDEGIEAQKTVITASLGAIALGDFKYQLGAANAGPQSAINLSVSADGLSLPVGLLPPNAGALTPSEDRHFGETQGHRHHCGRQRVDLGPQPAGRRTAPLRRQCGEGRGRFHQLGSGPDRVRPLACGRAGGRRRLRRLDPPRPQQADRGDHDPRAELRQDDGGGQRLGAGHRRPRPCRASRSPRGSPSPKATAA